MLIAMAAITTNVVKIQKVNLYGKYVMERKIEK
jgi:hypothetical protein